jgi:transcriptional regulator with XRE-family HTH domain
MSQDVPQWTTGDRLRKSLIHAEMSVTEMAEYLGVSRNTVTNYMHDHTKAPGPVLRLWALRTGVSMEWLTSGEEDGEEEMHTRRRARRRAALVTV